MSSSPSHKHLLQMCAHVGDKSRARQMWHLQKCHYTEPVKQQQQQQQQQLRIHTFIHVSQTLSASNVPLAHTQSTGPLHSSLHSLGLHRLRPHPSGVGQRAGLSHAQRIAHGQFDDSPRHHVTLRRQHHRSHRGHLFLREQKVFALLLLGAQMFRHIVCKHDIAAL